MEKQDVEQMGQTAQKMKGNGAVQDLLRSRETRRMMELLGDRAEVQGAAKAAAAGDPARLMEMMQQLMNSQEGAQLVEQITKQAKRSGL